jgi:hypothetical protein
VTYPHASPVRPPESVDRTPGERAKGRRAAGLERCDLMQMGMIGLRRMRASGVADTILSAQRHAFSGHEEKMS